MLRKALKTVAIAAVAALAGISLAAAQDRPDLVVAVQDIPPTLEPARELSNQGVRVTYSMFDTLIRRDFLSSPDGSGSALVPSLAESWTWVDDRTLEVHLRDGVKFHNGETLTAEDVVFTFSPERLTGDEAAIPEGKAYFGVLESVEAVDPLTVRFTTRTPDPIFEQRLASWTAWIVNKKDWLEHAEGGTPRFAVGTGPFMLDEYKADESIRLTAFDDYFGGTPTAASVTFRKVPEEAARIAGLVSGEFDIITNIPPDQIATLNSYDDVEARSIVLANSHVLVYNTAHPVLADVRVRQAMNLAIDRQLLVEALWAGEAVVPNSHQYPEFGELYDETRNGLVYDPDKARALLAEAGYDGEEIVYNTRANYYTNALPAAQAIVEMWKAVGLNARLNIVESTDDLPDEIRMVRTWSNSTRYPDPAGALWNLWGPNGGVQKNGEWVPQEFNALGAELDRTADMAKRREVFQGMLDIWEEDAPGTILYQPLETYGVRKSLKWQPYSFYYMDLRPYNLADEASAS